MMRRGHESCRLTGLRALLSPIQGSANTSRSPRSEGRSQQQKDADTSILLIGADPGGRGPESAPKPSMFRNIRNHNRNDNRNTAQNQQQIVWKPIGNQPEINRKSAENQPEIDRKPSGNQ